MDFKITKKKIIRATLFFVIIFSFNKCLQKDTYNSSNTYYIELVNFSDSLSKTISENIFGKVAYYKKNKLEIVSLNYETESYPNMHYFVNVTAAAKKIIPDSKKIRIEFTGEYSADSIRYSLQKFKYVDGQWKKISDLGVLKGSTSYKKAKQFALSEFSKQIVNSIVLYTYD